jgi:hypothetical protein
MNCEKKVDVQLTRVSIYLRMELFSLPYKTDDTLIINPLDDNDILPSKGKKILGLLEKSY